MLVSDSLTLILLKHETFALLEACHVNQAAAQTPEGVRSVPDGSKAIF